MLPPVEVAESYVPLACQATRTAMGQALALGLMIAALINCDKECGKKRRERGKRRVFVYICT